MLVVLIKNCGGPEIFLNLQVTLSHMLRRYETPGSVARDFLTLCSHWFSLSPSPIDDAK